jgi:hypothetical protein
MRPPVSPIGEHQEVAVTHLARGNALGPHPSNVSKIGRPRHAQRRSQATVAAGEERLDPSRRTTASRQSRSVMAPFGHDAAACRTLVRRCSGGSSINNVSSSSSPTSNTSGATPMQRAFDSHRFQFTRTRMFLSVSVSEFHQATNLVSSDTVDPMLRLKPLRGEQAAKRQHRRRPEDRCQ